MSTKRTPTVMLLLVVSSLIAICGLSAAGYTAVFKTAGDNSLIFAFLILLGAFFLAGISRVLANIGHELRESRLALFQDLRTLIARITAIEQRSGEALRDIYDSGIERTEAIQSLSENMAVIIRQAEASLIKALAETALKLAGAIQKSTQEAGEAIQRSAENSVQKLAGTVQRSAEDSTLKIGEAVQESGQAVNDSVRESGLRIGELIQKSAEVTGHALQQSAQDSALKLAGAVQKSTQEVGEAIRKSTEESSLQMEAEHKERLDMLNNQKEQLQNIYSSLEILKSVMEQSGCDSKDVSQNIYQIKNFFEQIEKHLDLKR